MEEVKKLRDLSFPESINGFSFTEYLAIFLGLIFALAVAEFFLSIGHMIRDRKRYKPYWEYYLWIIALLEIFFISWYIQWTRIPFLNEGMLYFMMLSIPNLIIFIIIAIFLPNTRGDTIIDLKDHFHKIVRPLFILLAVFLTVLIITELVIKTPIGQVAIYGQMVYLVIAIINAIWPNIKFRTVFMIVLIIQEGFVSSFL